MRNTVERVLNGAEDVLSFLFTNSSSALRRVKTMERKKRVNGVSKDVKSNPLTLDCATGCVSASKPDTGTAVASLKSPLFSNQLNNNNNKDFTQWTPLSLSDVPDSKCISELSSKHTSPHVDSLVESERTEQPGQSSSRPSERQRFSPDSCHEKSQGRSCLSDSSPGLTFSRKPRKFVYRVQHSESKRTPSVTGTSFLERDRPASLNMDHDLDTTQLCQAFAEDFSQEANLLNSPPRSAQSSHDGVLTPACATIEMSEVRRETESVVRCEGLAEHQEAEMIRLTNTQSVESTNRDSGYPTVCSGFSLETPSRSDTEHIHSGFKTANNKIIAIPLEAVMKAKAALDESVEHTTCTGASSVTEAMKAGTKQYKSYKPVTADAALEKSLSEHYHRGYGEAGRETSDGSVLRSEAAAENVPSTFMCQTNESGFNTASNRSVTVSCANLEKAKDVLTESEEETFDPCPSSNEPQVCDVKDARPSKPSRRSTGDGHGGSSLTASQRADVTELCIMLEETGSQDEFTQFKPTKIGSKCPDSMPFEREWDPELLAGIDFDDSFNCDLTVKQVSNKHQPKDVRQTSDTPASVPNSLTNGDVAVQSINARKSCRVPWEMPNMADESLQEKSFCSGFKTAKGNAVTVSEKCLSKARSLFADIESTEGHFGLQSDCKADLVKQKQRQSSDHQDIAMESVLELKPRSNLCNGNASSITKDAETCEENLEAQGTVVEKPDLMGNFGFTTAAGKEVKVSEKALQNAKKLLNELANDKETKHDNSPAKTTATTWTSVQNSSNVLEDVLHDPKTSDGSLPKGGKEHPFENSPEIKQATSPPSPRSVDGNGFKTASDKGASVSASAIQKSKPIFKDLDDSPRSPDETKSTEENTKPDVGGDAGQHALVGGFKMASGRGVSFSEKAFMKAKTFFQNRDPDRMDISQVKGDDTSVMDDCGFEAVAGNAVRLPGIDSLNKETLKKDSTDLNKYVQRKFTKTSTETLQAPSGCGFSTASGAVVSVSAEALQRVKAMFDYSNAASPGERRLEISEEKNTSRNETGKTCGFTTASGRKVAISEKALQKAQSLFTDCDVDGLGPDPCNSSAAKTSAASPERIRLPFNAASKKHIAVSERELNESKDESVSCDDVSVESPLTVQTRQRESRNREALSDTTESVPANAGKSAGRYEDTMNGGPKADRLGSGTCGFSTAGGKGVSVSESALAAAFEMFRDCDAQSVPNGQCRVTSGGPFANIDKTAAVPNTKATSPSLPSQATRDNPSLLSRHSLNLDGCTVTQRKYFEQEAMACTKALLEDELNEDGLSSSSDTGIRQRPAVLQEGCLEVNAGIRKRTSDDKSLTGKTFSKLLILGRRTFVLLFRTTNASLNGIQVNPL